LPIYPYFNLFLLLSYKINESQNNIVLGATQLGLDFGKNTTFCGVERALERAVKHEVDHAMENFE